jgi:hypothetical protein
MHNKFLTALQCKKPLKPYTLTGIRPRDDHYATPSGQLITILYIL